MTAWLILYALTERAVGRLGTTGVAGERLRSIRVGRLDVLVGAVTRSPRPTARHLLRYDRVLRSAWRRRSAVLPVRFGTLVRDRAELEVLLRARQRMLLERLRLVRNRAQMTVRIEPGAGIREPGSGIRDPGSGRSRGRRYLEARARAARLSDVPEVAVVRDAAARWVKAEHVERGDRLVTLYHLVPRSGVVGYQQAIERAARGANVRLRVSGPWPAYAFAGEK